jgi:hypothetical protein
MASVTQLLTRVAADEAVWSQANNSHLKQETRQSFPGGDAEENRAKPNFNTPPHFRGT